RAGGEGVQVLCAGRWTGRGRHRPTGQARFGQQTIAPRARRLRIAAVLVSSTVWRFCDGLGHTKRAIDLRLADWNNRQRIAIEVASNSRLGPPFESGQQHQARLSIKGGGQCFPSGAWATLSLTRTAVSLRPP